MNDEETFQAILSKCSEVTKRQVLEELDAEKGKTGGLIATQTLLRMIAARHGVQILQKRNSDHMLLINHLVPNLNCVTISGRVLAVFPAKMFEGKQPGKYASLMIADRTGILRVMLWNDKAELVESNAINAGQVVRFSRGYTKDDRNGKTELHIGEKSEVEVIRQDQTKELYPSIDHFAIDIKDVTPEKSVHLIGTVKTVFPRSTFTRQDNSTGKVLRFTIADSTGEMAVVAWNSKAETLEASLKTDAEVKLVNAKAKKGYNGELEVHIDDSTYSEVHTGSQSS